MVHEGESKSEACVCTKGKGIAEGRSKKRGKIRAEVE